MGRFVKAEQKVLVKPNIGWDTSPERAANTNPELVGRIVKAAYEAGASEVFAFDHTCDQWDRCYRMMTRNGPRGVSDADLVDLKALIAGTDIVAVDAGGFLVVLLLTWLTGRLYCSTICPSAFCRTPSIMWPVNSVARGSFSNTRRPKASGATAFCL